MVNIHPFHRLPIENLSFNDHPSVTVVDAVTDLSVLLNRYVRGLGIPAGTLHTAQYSEQLSPLTAKGVDLCDYSDIKSQTNVDVQTLTDAAIAQDKAAKAAKAGTQQLQATPPAE